MVLDNLKNLASLAQAAKAPPKGLQVLKLGLDEVRPKPNQVRKSFSGIDELASSLRQEGQIQPIIVSPRGADGHYQIQKGERRWRACREAGLATVDAIVQDPAPSALEATAGELAENLQRDDLTPLEVAGALQQFVLAGWKQKDIALRIGKTVPFVSSHLGLLKLPEPVLAVYLEGISRDPETLNNLRQLHELDAARCLGLCQDAARVGVSRQLSREALNSLKKPSPATEAQPPSKPPAKGKAGRVPPNQGQGVAGQGWRSARPPELRLEVSLAWGGRVVAGQLLMDRADHDPTCVWVRLAGGQVVRVPASQLTLERMAAP